MFVVLGVLCLGLFGAVTVYLLRDTSLGTPANNAPGAVASTTAQMMADAAAPSVPPATSGASPIPTSETYAQADTHGDIHGHASCRTRSYPATSA